MRGVQEIGSLTTIVIVGDVAGKLTSGRPVVRNNCIGSVGLTSPCSSVTGGGPGGFARIVLWSLTDLAALAVLAIRRGASGAQESPDAVPGRCAAPTGRWRRDFPVAAPTQSVHCGLTPMSPMAAAGFTPIHSASRPWKLVYPERPTS